MGGKGPEGVHRRTFLQDAGAGLAIGALDGSPFPPLRYGTTRPPLTLALGREHVSSIAETRGAVAQAVEDAEPGEWIRGYGWDQGYLEEGRYPTREDTDDVSPENPVVLHAWSGHAVWVNSVALELVGVDHTTEAPSGGEIHRYGDGEPAGVLGESAVDLVEDGVPTRARTAWMSEEYEAGGLGGLALPGDTGEDQQDALHRRIRTAHDAGFQAGVHSCGDRAIDAVVDAYARGIGELGHQGLRHYVIHGDFVSQRSLNTLSAHGLGVNLNPSVERSLSRQLEEVLGRRRTDCQWPYRAALSSGVVVAGSSDAPNVPPDFLEGIAGTLTRRGLATGAVFGEDEVLDLEQALHTYTTAGAWQDGAEDWKGTLAEGMVADLVVLDGDLLHTPGEEVAEIPVGMTVVGGEVVFDTASASITQATAPAAASRAAGLNTYMAVGCCGTEAGRHGART